jgi:hypothetical protein
VSQVEVKDTVSCSGTPGHLHVGCVVELKENEENDGKLGKLRLLLLGLLALEILGLLLLELLGLLLLGLLLLELLLLELLLLELLLLELLLLELLLLGQIQSHSFGLATTRPLSC